MPKFCETTPEEDAAIRRLYEAVNTLPPSLKIKVDDFDEPATLDVWKVKGPHQHSLAGRIEARVL